MFQLILNPTRDWNFTSTLHLGLITMFQLILNPTRDWNPEKKVEGTKLQDCSN